MGVDFSEIKKLTEVVENISATRDEVIDNIAKELTARLFRMVVTRTPVGKSIVIYRSILDVNNKHVLYESGKRKGQAKYKKTTTHTGGTLRRGWTVTDLSYFGTHMFKISNNIFYCTYVENGHRQTPGRYVPAIGKKLKKSWVPGKHMLKLSTEELQRQAQPFVEKKINQWLNEVMK